MLSLPTVGRDIVDGVPPIYRIMNYFGWAHVIVMRVWTVAAVMAFTMFAYAFVGTTYHGGNPGMFLAVLVGGYMMITGIRNIPFRLSQYRMHKQIRRMER